MGFIIDNIYVNKKSNFIYDTFFTLKHIIADVYSTKRQIKTFEEAKQATNCYVVLEGDYGEKKYLVCPMNLVKCTEKELYILLSDLDNIAWADLDATRLYYTVCKPNEIISEKVMGETFLGNEFWVNNEFQYIKNEIAQVIFGVSPRIKEPRKIITSSSPNP